MLFMFVLLFLERENAKCVLNAKQSYCKFWGNGRETANIFVSTVSGVVCFFKRIFTPHTGMDDAFGHALGTAWGGVVTD